MRLLITNLLASALVIFGAASASAYATSMSSAQAGQTLGISDTVTVTVTHDTQNDVDITLLSVGVHFDNTIFTHSGSTAATYALYGGGKSTYVIPASTNGQLRVGTNDQVNLDWISSSLPAGNTDAGSFVMGTITFHVQALGDGEGHFTLSNSSAGNVLQLADGSNPVNSVSGDFVVYTPEPTTALLVGLGLLGLGFAGRRQA